MLFTKGCRMSGCIEKQLKLGWKKWFKKSKIVDKALKKIQDNITWAYLLRKCSNSIFPRTDQ